MLGTRVGMAFSVIGFGMLIGGPAAGMVLDPGYSESELLNFMGLWIFGGVTAVVSGCLYVLVRCLLVGFKIEVKV